VAEKQIKEQNKFAEPLSKNWQSMSVGFQQRHVNVNNFTAICITGLAAGESFRTRCVIEDSNPLFSL